ncbi:MAG: ABC transporter ATP-binding protein [Anaerovoracaceae bacterium]|nr:ABC transporter ATP-binding protein [Clostridiales bacterium]
MPNAIEIKGLNKSYPGFLLEDIHLDLPRGSILGLVGENGAGKSTLIKLTLKAINRDSGTVRVLDADLDDPDFGRIKEEVGVVLDEAYYPEVLTAQQLEKVMAYTFSNWDREAYQNYLKRFQLPEQKKFRNFSRGMKMKLALAVALSHDPKLLLLDEATSGLDPMIRDEMLDLFNEFTREENHSILISSHIVSDLEKVCDYIAFLHQGKLLLCEEKDRLVEKYAVVKIGRQDLEALDPEALAGKREGKYGVEALVYRDLIPSTFATEHTSLEDIILFLAKGGARG